MQFRSPVQGPPPPRPAEFLYVSTLFEPDVATGGVAHVPAASSCRACFRWAPASCQPLGRMSQTGNACDACNSSGRAFARGRSRTRFTVVSSPW